MILFLTLSTKHDKYFMKCNLCGILIYTDIVNPLFNVRGGLCCKYVIDLSVGYNYKF